MNERYVFINDNFCVEQEAKLHISDMALQRGYAIFDFFKTVNSKPVFPEYHLNRFYHSAQQMQLPVSFTAQELTGIIAQLMNKNKIADSGIRLTLTGGYAADGYSIQRPNLIITQQPLHPAQAKSISLVTYNYQRQLPHIKTIDYLMAISLRNYVKQQGADEVLYCNNSELRECPRANFFAVMPGKKIITPKNQVLHGITRQKLLELKSVEDHSITEENITTSDLQSMEEAFITSTTKGVMPVHSINGSKIGNGSTGQVTQLLQQRLQDIINKEIGTAQ